MRKFLFLAVALVGIGALAYAYFNTSVNPTRVLTQAIEAHGGAAAIARTRTGRLAGSAEEGSRFGTRYPYRWEEWFQAPNQFKRVMIRQVDGRTQRLISLAPANKRWFQTEGGPLEPLDFATNEPASSLFFLQQLVDLDKQKVPLVSIPAENVNGQPTVGFKARSDDDAVELFFDPETKLCAKLKRVLGSQPSERTVLEVILSAYQEHDGVRIPMKITFLRDGQLDRELMVEKVEFRDQLPAEIFTGP